MPNTWIKFRRGSGKYVDQFTAKRGRRLLKRKGGRIGGHAPSGNFFNFKHLKCPFQAFWVSQTTCSLLLLKIYIHKIYKIQSGSLLKFYLTYCFFVHLDKYIFISIFLLWKFCPISVKQWKPIWIRAWNQLALNTERGNLNNFFRFKYYYRGKEPYASR